MFIKILNKHEEIIGVENLISPSFIRFQKNSGLYIRSSRKDAIGLISNDQKYIYIFDGIEPPTDNIEFTATEISEAEYNYYLQQLEWPIQPEEPEIQEEIEQEIILTPMEMMNRLRELEEEIKILKEEKNS